ncbi:hypothetical protein AGMMS50293_10960 [Spirochaetia bacterium]|nr:hypothetical protein AGMMS50293_10960 [Spirochaetia bacterium]
MITLKKESNINPSATNKRYMFAFTLLVWAAAGVFAQSGDGFSPFVSEIRVETRNNLIRLTWTDSRDVRGPVYIFRSARPFNGVIPNSKPVELAYGAQSFIDETDGLESIHYFIAASDTSGRRFDIFIPQANTTTVFAAQGEEAPPAAEIAPEPETSGLWAQVDGEQVIITYRLVDTAEAPKNAVLYRSVHPIRQPQDLLNAVVVQSGISFPFVDYPVPGLSWYYAIIAEDDLTGGRMNIYPGRNATTQAAAISGGVSPVQAIRSMPLPAMTVYNAVPGGDSWWDIPNRLPLSPETQKALENVQITRPNPLPPKNARVFRRDLETPAGGEESALMRIVQGSFSKRDWETAREELLNYLALPHSGDTESRARFYLGQTWYFAGKYREALIEFLFVQSQHPTEANEWIEATLGALVQ